MAKPQSISKKPTLSWKGLHDRINPILESFVSSKKGKYTPLGPGFLNLTYLEAEENLILHRFCKKFERPDNSLALSRKNATVKAMFDYDNEWAIRWFQPARDRTLDGFARLQLYRARENLRNAINSHYNLSVDNIGFPSGETVVSARGDVSLYAKMRDRSQLICTEDCFITFCQLAYNHVGLRHVIKRHYRQLCEDNQIDMKSLNSLIWNTAKYGSGPQKTKKAQYRAFVAKCRYVVTLTDHARITTVRKENSKDRVIELDAFCNMVTQRTIANSVRKLIMKVYGINLDESQVIHKLLIQDLQNATIDLSNASNSVWYKVVEWLFAGTKFWEHLKLARSGMVRFGETQHSLNMLSPMGNGYTFEVMTLILLGVSREYDSFAHVFGDDIIVDRDVAGPLIHLLEYMGFQTNVQKTFTDGKFRESCGGFTSHGEYITSFDFEWCEDEVEAVVAINKVFHLKETRSLLHSELLQLYERLIEQVPPSLLRGAHAFTNYSREKIASEVEHFVSERLTNRKDNKGNLVFSVGRYSRVQNNYSYFGHSTTKAEISNDKYDLSTGVLAHPSYVQKVQRKDDKCKSYFKTAEFVQMRKDLNWISTGIGPRPMPHVTLVLRKTNKRYTYKDANGRSRPWLPLDDVSRLISLYYLSCGRVLTPTFRDTRVSTTLVQYCVS